jgi:hypothetical protein
MNIAAPKIGVLQICPETQSGASLESSTIDINYISVVYGDVSINETAMVRGWQTSLGITPKYICVQQYYPLDLKVRKNELIAFKTLAYAIV